MGTTANTDVENWDYGSDIYPHLIKLVRTVTSYQDGGFYAAVIFDGTDFKLLNPFIPPDELTDDNYDINTTQGTLQRTTTTAAAGHSTFPPPLCLDLASAALLPPRRTSRLPLMTLPGAATWAAKVLPLLTLPAPFSTA